MSLYGMMSTGASGMNAQANRLSTVADNIANANTTGYKKASVQFSSLVLPGANGSYNSGAVQTDVRYAISEPGTLAFTTSSTDLAIDGDGFFIVEDTNGVPMLTRAGSFVPDGDGKLVNAAGYTLLGYDYESGVPAPVVNGFDGLVPVNISSGSLAANASTLGIFSANLDRWRSYWSLPPTRPSKQTPRRRIQPTRVSYWWHKMTILGGRGACSIFYYNENRQNKHMGSHRPYDRALAARTFVAKRGYERYLSLTLFFMHLFCDITTTLEFDPLGTRVCWTRATQIRPDIGHTDRAKAAPQLTVESV